jgi:hypothetical protein
LSSVRSNKSAFSRQQIPKASLVLVLEKLGVAAEYLGTPSKKEILLLNYEYQDELKCQIERFVSYYNGVRYHEEIGNVAPDGV